MELLELAESDKFELDLRMALGIANFGENKPFFATFNGSNGKDACTGCRKLRM